MSEPRRTERSNKGFNSQLHSDLYENEKLEKSAKGKLWLFYYKGDTNSFPIEYNSCRWPEGTTLAQKLELRIGDKMAIRYKNVPIKASLSGIVLKADVVRAEAAVAKKVADADRTLTDVSYHGLVKISSNYFFAYCY